MKFLVFLLTIYVLFSSIRYSIYELKKNNKLGGLTTLFLGILQIIITNYTLFILNR